MLEVFTKDELIDKLVAIRKMGWVENYRKGNDGSVGNILEDLLGIEENNLAVANSGEWELKTKRKRSNSLTTLIHNEPSPRKARLVSNVLLPLYGWRHKNAGLKYPEDELSFRQTINCNSYSDRGFGIFLDKQAEKICVDFDASKIQDRHSEWLESVKGRTGLGKINPMPYWGYRDISAHLGSKLMNCFFILADVKTKEGKEYVSYSEIKMLSEFSMSKFLSALEEGLIYIDFDARTGHNHGTKFRIREQNLSKLYKNEILI